VAVALAFAGTALARAGFALVSVAPSFGTQVLLDVLGTLALVLTYALVASGALAERAGPLRSLWVTLLAAAGLLALEAAAGLLLPVHTTPGTLLPADVGGALVVAVVGGLEGALAIGILLGLRPLVLYRRRVGTVAAWRAMLVTALIAAVAVSGRNLDMPTHEVLLGLDALGILIGLGLAFRQGWVVDLSVRHRLAAAALALALSAALVGLLFVRTAGPAVAVLSDSGPVPLGALFSRPVSNLFAHAAAFGVLYALTAGLVLIFQLPSAESAAQRAGERRALRLLADLSGSLLDRPALTAAIARGPVEARLADAAWLAVVDTSSGSLAPRVVAADGIALEAAAAAADVQALLRGAAEADDGPLLLERAESDHRVRARPGDGVGSLAVFPLVAGGQPRGALLAARRAAAGFEADDLGALATFASQAALALSHADLFAEALDAERLTRELALAREVQQRLFPQTLPALDGLEVAAAERPAREMGGDYYDVATLGADCVGVLVADVSGKGAAAAFYMAELKGIFQSVSRLTRAPGQFLAQANEALTPSLGRGAFVSAAYAVLDAEAGTLSLARAGHPPAVLARDPARADGGRWLLRGGGVAIGLDRGPLFRRTLREQTVDLAPGDTLLLYTDGLVEVRNPAGEEYGYERLADAVQALRAEPAEAIRDALLAAHADWSGGAEPADDLTLVVLRWTGRGASPPARTDGATAPISERPAFPPLP
jgi:serine phosphatase RsbU (regulator of sigma subunit)